MALVQAARYPLLSKQLGGQAQHEELEFQLGGADPLPAGNHPLRTLALKELESLSRLLQQDGSHQGLGGLGAAQLAATLIVNELECHFGGRVGPLEKPPCMQHDLYLARLDAAQQDWTRKIGVRMLLPGFLCNFCAAQHELK